MAQKNFCSPFESTAYEKKTKQQQQQQQNILNTVSRLLRLHRINHPNCLMPSQTYLFFCRV